MALNLVPKERHMHVKYEGPESYQSKDIANVKVFADKQTDKMTLDGKSLTEFDKKSVDFKSVDFYLMSKSILSQDAVSKSETSQEITRSLADLNLVSYVYDSNVKTNTNFQLDVSYGSSEKCNEKY